MRHLALKIFAVLGATTLWFFVVSGKTYTTEAEMELRLIRLPHNLAVASYVPRHIPVTLEGQGFDLIRLKSSAKQAWLEVDLSGAQMGNNPVTLTENHFRTLRPSAVRLRAIHGVSTLNIELDARIHRDIPLRLAQEIPVKPGYVRVGDPQLSPHVLRVSGARKILTRLYEIPVRLASTEPWSTSDTIAVLPDWSALPTQIDFDSSTIRLTADVQKLISREFSSVPVQLIGPFSREHYTIQPQQVFVNLSGGERVLHRLNASDIRVFVEFSRFKLEGTDTLSPTLSAPIPIHEYRIHPPFVRLKALSHPGAPSPAHPL